MFDEGRKESMDEIERVDVDMAREYLYCRAFAMYEELGIVETGECL